jgi:hypothetical protein
LITRAKRTKYLQRNDDIARKARTLDGVEFGSLAEKHRYQHYLKPLLSFKHIKNLRYEPELKLVVNGYEIGVFTPDFTYETPDGKTIIEEVKGPKESRDFTLRWKLAQALYPNLTFFLLRAIYRGGVYTYSVVKRVPKRQKPPHC